MFNKKYVKFIGGNFKIFLKDRKINLNKRKDIVCFWREDLIS